MEEEVAEIPIVLGQKRKKFSCISHSRLLLHFCLDLEAILSDYKGNLLNQWGQPVIRMLTVNFS